MKRLREVKQEIITRVTLRTQIHMASEVARIAPETRATKTEIEGRKRHAELGREPECWHKVEEETVQTELPLMRQHSAKCLSSHMVLQCSGILRSAKRKTSWPI